MLRKLRIGPRLIVLIAVQTLVAVAVGTAGLLGLGYAANSTEQLSRNVQDGTRLSYLAETLRSDVLDTVYGVNLGVLTWAEGRERLAGAKQRLDEDWSAFRSGLSKDDAEFVDDVLTPGFETARGAIDEVAGLLEREDAVNLSLFLVNDARDLIAPFVNAVLASTAERQLLAEETFATTLATSRNFLYAAAAVLALGLLISGGLGFVIYRSIVAPLRAIERTVHQVAEGDLSTRTGITGRDEPGQLGEALDNLLEDRVSTLAHAEVENEQLNESVLKLLDAVARLSERDLTVVVPVTPDVTGPVADAINQMAEETGRVLAGVSQIAARVGAASAAVNKKAVVVNEVASAQRAEIERTAKELEAASVALRRVADNARECSARAERTGDTTQGAMRAVNSTLAGMREIREAIQDTGRRIKRLGERSQEITGIVDIINTIAERTHVLALNASMQAAAAGEAGRGFAVVAEEVQRLAESSRDATRQIGGLVKNMQVDTNDTIVTMDRTIAQVVEGSRTAETAWQQMSLTQEATTELVDSVREIADASAQQAKLSGELRDRSVAMVKGTRQTLQEILDQLRYTKALVQYARQLLQSVRVFKLPALVDKATDRRAS